jgi:hypothetical protein
LKSHHVFLVAPPGFEADRVPFGAVDQFERTAHPLGERRHVRDRPHPLPQRERAEPAQLAPDRDTVLRGLRWKPEHQHQPAI